MSFITTLTSTKNASSTDYQPIYPLKYDPKSGPYQPIQSLEESIKANFEIILLTHPGEWPMDPQLGVGIRKFLFNNYGSFNLQELQATIVNQIGLYLPSVQLLNLEVISNDELQDRNTLAIRILYTILGKTVVDSTISADEKGDFSIDTNVINKLTPSFRDRVSKLRSQITEI